MDDGSRYASRKTKSDLVDERMGMRVVVGLWHKVVIRVFTFQH